MKEPTKNQIKSLIINGTLYANYHMDKNILFLKTRKLIIKDNAGESENFTAAIISQIEQKEFVGISFLNIK